MNDADDDRAAPYRALIRASTPGEADRFATVFVAEGVRTVRLLFERGWPVESLLLSERRLSSVGDLLRSAGVARATVYVATQDVLDGIAGWNVHRGVLAVVRRPPDLGVARVVAGAGRLLLGIEAVNDLENLGSLFRNAAAFGAGGVVLDPRTADPLYRRSVRVSVGHVLDVPYARSGEWPGELVAAARRGGRRILALTPGGSETLDSILGRYPRPGSASTAAEPGAAPSWVVLVGAEGDGLSAPALAAADYQVRIPMASGVDSVNVATAAAIALYRLAGLS